MTTGKRIVITAAALLSVFACHACAQDKQNSILVEIKSAWTAREKSLEAFSMRYEVRSVQASVASMVKGQIVPMKPHADSTLTIAQFVGSGRNLRFDLSKSGSTEQESTLLYNGEVVTELMGPNADSPRYNAVKAKFNRSSLKMVAGYQPLLLLTRPLTVANVDLDHATVEAETTIREKSCITISSGTSRYFVHNDGQDFPILRMQRVNKDGPHAQYDFMYGEDGSSIQPMFWTFTAGIDSNTEPRLLLGVVTEFSPFKPADTKFTLDFPSKTHVLDMSGANVNEFDVP